MRRCSRRRSGWGTPRRNPAFDVGGVDAAQKLALLAAIAFGTRVDFEGMTIEGIERVSLADIEHAAELGYRIKLLGVARMTPAGLEARMQPCLVPAGSPLGQLDGVTNMVVIEGDFVGRIVMSGPGRGGGADGFGDRRRHRRHRARAGDPAVRAAGGEPGGGAAGRGRGGCGGLLPAVPGGGCAGRFGAGGGGAGGGGDLDQPDAAGGARDGGGAGADRHAPGGTGGAGPGAGGDCGVARFAGRRRWRSGSRRFDANGLRRFARRTIHVHVMYNACTRIRVGTDWLTWTGASPRAPS